jgi:hypothetical protein
MVDARPISAPAVAVDAARTVSVVTNPLALDSAAGAQELIGAAPFTCPTLVRKAAFTTGRYLAAAVIRTLVASIGERFVAGIVEPVAPFWCTGIYLRVGVVTIDTRNISVAVAVALAGDAHAVLAHVSLVWADDSLAGVFAHARAPIASCPSGAYDSVAGVVGSHALGVDTEPTGWADR